jgi:tRNA pseudouridine38-40 synthase
MHYRLTLQYDGTGFLGWQLQPQGPTVQGAVETALARLFGQPVRLQAAGRTDAGVHALGQVACFRSVKAIPAGEVQRALNALTPADVAVTAVDLVPEGFDPRRAARSRTYGYRIWTQPWRSPFWHRFTWQVCARLDLQAMRDAALCILGEHDFASFQAADCDAAHAVRRVLRSEWVREAEQIIYTIEATAFVRHMVRNLVGTLVEVGLGNRTLADFGRLLEARDRRRAGATAPARGLFLISVQYPETGPPGSA